MRNSQAVSDRWHGGALLWVGLGFRQKHPAESRLRGELSGEAGQALVLVVLVIGIVLVPLTLALLAMSALVVAKSQLGQAADAAALAAVQAEPPGPVTLAVSWEIYTCVQQNMDTECAPVAPQTTDVTGTVSALFAATDSPGFGSLPGWAQRAGCVGTVWSGAGVPPGAYPICLRQRVVAVGAPTVISTPMLLAASRAFVANVAFTPDLRGASLRSLRLGSEGEVKVAASAHLRRALFSRTVISATAMAWGIRSS